MSSEIELQPLVKTRSRKASLLLALVAAFGVVALLLGFGVWQSTRDAEALQRFPDRVEVLSAGWAPGPPGVVHMKLRLTRKDGQTFDPRSSVMLADTAKPTSSLNRYMNGWTDRNANRPTREVLLDFQHPLNPRDVPNEPLRIEMTGWTQPRLPKLWLEGLKHRFGLGPMPRVVVPFYELEGAFVILPAPPPTTKNSPSP